jgi:hypothetical protein
MEKDKTNKQDLMTFRVAREKEKREKVRQRTMFIGWSWVGRVHSVKKGMKIEESKPRKRRSFKP